jgi:hypothetical protein
VKTEDIFDPDFPPSMPAVPYCADCRDKCTNASPCRCCELGRPGQRHEQARDLLARFAHQAPSVADGVRGDEFEHYVHETLVYWLDVAVAVMRDEGVDGPTRHRVLTAVMCAVYAPAAAYHRQGERSRLMAVYERAATPSVMVVASEEERLRILNQFKVKPREGGTGG